MSVTVEEHGSGLVNWFLGVLVAAVSSLATVIGYLWRVAEGKNADAIQALRTDAKLTIERHDHEIQELQQRAEECERDRADLRVRVAQMETEISFLRGPDGRTKLDP